MKFTQHLNAHITPEWRKQYINYREMKMFLQAALKEAPPLDITDKRVWEQHVKEFDVDFFRYCSHELVKINSFFSEKLAEAVRRFTSLSHEAEMIKLLTGDQQTRKSIIVLRVSATTSKRQQLKLAFSEFYLFLVLLQNYQTLNYTGFRKILKKHDKYLQTKTGAAWMKKHVETAEFSTNKNVDKLIAETEDIVTHTLEFGNRQNAMKYLRVPRFEERFSPWCTFKVGLFSGAFIVLVVIIVFTSIRYQDRSIWQILSRLYRAPIFVIQYLFLLGINVYGWRSSGINHILIFELDPRKHLSEQDIFEITSFFALIWSISVLASLNSDYLGIPPFVQPLTLYALFMIYLLNPTRTFKYESRRWFLTVLGRTFCAPFLYVEFSDFWLADQLNSLHTVLLDFQYFLCFYMYNTSWSRITEGNICVAHEYSTRPFIICLPAWIRLAQCCRRYRDTRRASPHLLNAIKYGMSFFVVFFSHIHLKNAQYYVLSTENPYFYPLLAVSVISSCFAFTWDVKFDWGLFRAAVNGKRFLREEMIYSHASYYYCAIVGNFLLRFAWALSLTLAEMGYAHSDLIFSIVAPLEIFRRYVWNYFRLENEHLNNVGKFRAVRDISIRPIKQDDEAPKRAEKH